MSQDVCIHAMKTKSVRRHVHEYNPVVSADQTNSLVTRKTDGVRGLLHPEHIFSPSSFNA